MTYFNDFEDVTDTWTIKYDETQFLRNKKRETQLNYAFRLKFYQKMGRFPRQSDAIAPKALDYLKDQLELSEVEVLDAPDRTERRRHSEIKTFLCLRPFTETDQTELDDWLRSNPGLLNFSTEDLKTSIRVWVLHQGCTPITERDIVRMCAALRAKHDQAEYERIFGLLDQTAIQALTHSMAGQGQHPSLAEIRGHSGKPNHKTFDETIRLLSFIQSLALPREYIGAIHDDWCKDIRKRVMHLKPAEIRRHNPAKQTGMYAVYLHHKEQALTDSAIDTVLTLIQAQRRRARNAFATDAVQNANKLINRDKLLIEILEASLADPKGSVEDVVFNIIGKTEALSIVNAKTLLQPKSVSTFAHMHKRWKTTYRRLLKTLLETVTFHSNNPQCYPLLEALDWISLNFHTRKIIAGRDDIPIEGVIPKSMMPSVVGKGGVVDKYSYELCVVTSLRDRLRSRAIWVSGSQTYRNPDEDTPPDFDANIEKYCKILDLDAGPARLVETLKFEMEQQLLGLNAEIVKNPHISIDWGEKRRFKISKLPRLDEPRNLLSLKRELGRRWPMTSLMDMLKETALDTNFLKVFKTIGDYQNIDAASLRKRQLLCLYALGSNTGIKRTSAAIDDVSYEQLLHVNRRFIDAEAVQEANRIVVNSILDTRDPDIWGSHSTTCASDSKQFQAWSQNPRAEKHLRYDDNGLMIYWHVENGSVCVYSQAKKVSTPEPASMIAGFLKHASKLKINQHFVDSHGQTEIAFAFCYLLGFDLAPRIKNIAGFKLYLPEAGISSVLDEIRCVTNRPINWDLVREQYSEMVKYAVSMKLGRSDPDKILRRFYKADIMHPTHKGLAELGRAVKTIFACRYLRSLTFRQEIQKGLNVMENWNSATNFVFYGRSGEISTNIEEGQDLAVQSLHLLQNSMIYVNTHMYQSVLSEPAWRSKMTPNDYRAITPLIYEYVNPYGKIELNLAKRIQYRQQV